MLKLTSIRDYSKKNKITDAAVRKNKNLHLVKFHDLTYVIENDESYEKLQNKSKIQTANIKALKNEIGQYTKQEELILEQKQRIAKLEERIQMLEDKLDSQVAKKEELYEKVIGQMLQLENKKN